MMKRKRWSVAAAGLLLAGVTVACSDGARPVGPDVEARLNTEGSSERGPGAVIGSGSAESTTTTTATDTTGRGPGGVIGSGH